MTTRIQLHGPVAVDAMTPTPRTVLDRLCQLLAAGVDAFPDEHRSNFYTVRDQDCQIYFYISPVTAKVWVLDSHQASAAAIAAYAAAQPA
jgi:hypothetical protein